MAHTSSRLLLSTVARTRVLLLAVVLVSCRCILAACPPEPIFISLGNCTILSEQDAIHSWGALVSVSSSDDSKLLQNLCGVPSTVTNSVFYTTSLLCSQDNLAKYNMTHEQCLSRRGGGIEVNDSGVPTGDDPPGPADVGILDELDSAWKTIMGNANPFPAAVYATLHLHGGDKITMTSGLIEAGNNHTTTHISLGDRSVLLSSLVAAGKIAARSFGFDAGSQSYWAPRQGGLVLGGTDEGARVGTEVRFDMTYNRMVGKRYCALQVNIKNMVLRPADGGADYPLGIEATHPQLSCLEMYDNHPRLPRSVIRSLQDGFKSFTGYTGDSIYYTAANPTAPPSSDAMMRQLEQIYIPEPGLIYPYNNLTSKFKGSLVITLNSNLTVDGDDFVVEIPAEELYNPVRGIARDGTQVVNTNFTQLAVYQDEAPIEAAVLGKGFLSRAYLYVNYDENYFTLTHAATSGSTILVPTGGDNGSCGGNGSGWSPVTIALVAAVSVLGLALLAALAYWLTKKHWTGPMFTWPWGHKSMSWTKPHDGTTSGTSGTLGEQGLEYMRARQTGTPAFPPANHAMRSTVPGGICEETTTNPSDRTAATYSSNLQQRVGSIDTATTRGRQASEVEASPARAPLTSRDGRRPELAAGEQRVELESPTGIAPVLYAGVTEFRSQSSPNVGGRPLHKLRTWSGSGSAVIDPRPSTGREQSESGVRRT